MRSITKEELKLLADSLYFELNEEQYDLLQKEFDSLMNDFEFLDKFKVDDLKPTYFAINKSQHNLREDSPIDCDSKEVLNSSENIKDDFIVVK